MSKTRLLKSCKHIVTCDAHDRILSDTDLLIVDGKIEKIEKNIFYPEAETVEASKLIIYPGLINTHHHFFQSFVRNRVQFDWTQLSLLEWLDAIYPVFSRINEDNIYHASLVAMSELIKHGCTTSFDHQYNFNVNTGLKVCDRQFEAANLMGMRFIAGRGCNTLPMAEGSTIPDAMLETTDTFLKDCERLISLHHDPGFGSMQQVVVAPCQPINSYPETFKEAALLARDKNVSLHTHLGEGETDALYERSGLRSIDWCEKYDFIGSDTWFAHGWEFHEPEIKQLASTNTGISHCPAPVFLVGTHITQTSLMHKHGLRLSLGTDGSASNDNSNLMESLRLSYLLQCLNAQHQDCPVPPASEFLKLATVGGAACLNRDDIGQLSPGFCADLFAIDASKMEYIGAAEEPAGIPTKVGINEPVALTIINGEVVWDGKSLLNVDEPRLAEAANISLQSLFEI